MSASHGRRVTILLTALLAGCAINPPYQPPKNETLPARFGAAGDGAMAAGGETKPADVDPVHWWRALGDPQLNALVERAQTHNPDIEVALARLQQARVYEVVVSGSASPQIGLSAGGGRGTGSDATRGRVSNALRSAETGAGLQRIAYGAGFDGSWTIDLAGYYKSAREAAAADTGAALAMRQAVLVAIVADVVNAWEQLRALQLQQIVLQRSLASTTELQHLLAERYRHGLINALDVTVATRETDRLRADVAPLSARIESARNTLAVLTGQFPEQLGVFEPAAALSALPEDVATGLPIELLSRRPDIRAAERTLAGATAQAGMAAARLMPTVVLNGGIGAEGQSLFAGNNKGLHMWSLGASAYWSLLDFGVLDGLSEMSDLEVQVNAARYRRVVLQAVSEVDSAVSGYRAALLRRRALEQAVASGADAVRLARERYDRGLADFLNVADAERQQYALQAQFVQAQSDAATAFVAVYRALGGGWEDAPQPPPIRAPEPAVLAAFHHLLDPEAGPAAARAVAPVKD